MDAATESESASEGWLLLCLEPAKARRVWRKPERATRARAGGNHSRVWSRTSDPLAGWRAMAKQAMVRRSSSKTDSDGSGYLFVNV